MTLIIWIEGEDWKAYIWWDKSWSNGRTSSIILEPKVFKKWEVIFWYTSTFRFWQIIKNIVTFEKNIYNLEDLNYLIQTVVKNIIYYLKEEWHIKDNNKMLTWWNLILWYKWKIYELQDDFSLLRTKRLYTAVWCWQDFALASLYENNKKFTNPKDAIKKAMETTNEFCIGTVSQKCDIIFI